MKAAVFQGTGSIGLKERDLPDTPPGWVRIAVTAGGICGSDLHLLHGKLLPNKGIQPGHEVTGIVDSVGDNCSIASGTRVALEPILGCHQCHFCHTGSANLCPETQLFGFALPGGLAEFISVPEDALHILPDDLSSKAAALCEPLAVCVRGMRIGGISPGDRVAILGAGSIGLSSILTAKAAGATEVLVTARYPHQQALARTLGADGIFESAEKLLAEIGDQHVDVVVETVGGSANTISEAVQIARTGGRLVMLGVFDSDPTLPGFLFFQKELTLAASNCYGREHASIGDFALGTKIVCDHASTLEELVTHSFSLDQVAEAFATADDKSTRSIKVQIVNG
jgi:L-iditol 2-dehydrogenase